MSDPNSKIVKKTLQQKGNADTIQYIVADDYERHMLMAHVANEVIQPVNALWNMKGVNGITIKKSDSNVIIAFDPSQIGNMTPQSTGGSTYITSGSVSGGDTFNCSCRYI
jgi:hypothetical protein